MNISPNPHASLPCEGICIYSDLDATFLDSKGKLVPRNLEAIERFKALGGRFSMATGRSAYTLADAFPNFPDICNMPIIACNGACVFDYMQDKMLIEAGLDGKYTTDALNDMLAHFTNIELKHDVSENAVSASQLTELRIRYYDRKFNNNDFGMPPVDPELIYDWFKVVIICTPEILADIRTYMKGIHGDYFTYNQSCANFLELLNRNASKGKMLSGMRSLLEKEHGRAFKIYAIGDYENDLEMILAADVGVCPSNANPMVKEAADLMVCSNDEGAIADLIERIIAENT
ncbi:MAG: HAD-IIB family hydrolase [Clostridia bacterium]|nr:HAD-IIB family hydrolase [Clostridia bacterium]MBQ4574787.1 HAD-IIB family hydrolase [Clostridia bacterium]